MEGGSECTKFEHNVIFEHRRCWIQEEFPKNYVNCFDRTNLCFLCVFDKLNWLCSVSQCSPVLLTVTVLCCVVLQGRRYLSGCSPACAVALSVPQCSPVLLASPPQTRVTPPYNFSPTRSSISLLRSVFSIYLNVVLFMCFEIWNPNRRRSIIQ